MLNGHYKMNTLGLYQIFNNEEAAFNIAIQNKMIYNEMICENCNCSMSLITDGSKKFRCSHTRWYFLNAFFQKVKGPFNLF